MLTFFGTRLKNSSKMADHSDLIAELPVVEKMTTQERLRHAKKRRLHQLKIWSQKEKDLTSKRHKTNHNKKVKSHHRRVHFDYGVMLLEAAARCDVDEVRRLLLNGVNPDSTNEDGLTALHQCCIDDSHEMMKALLEFGANINAEDSEKWTPLHAAATCGHLNLAKHLINKGANLLAVNADGNMPYDICEDEKTLDYIESEMAKRGVTQQVIDDTRAATEMRMLKDLKEYYASKSAIDIEEHGITPLHIASANGYITVVELLLENGANLNSADSDGWQPIHAAACWGHPDIVELLAYHGADLNACTKNGETPFDICEDLDLKKRIQELKNEMETRKLNQQPIKLRRSQSQNTRSQSVRRTSLRDKSQISWKEAREEAKMRLEQQENLLNIPDDQKSNHKLEPEAGTMNSKPVINVDDITLVLPTEPKAETQTDTNILSPNADTFLTIQKIEAEAATQTLRHENGENKKINETNTEKRVITEGDASKHLNHDDSIDFDVNASINTTGSGELNGNGGPGSTGTLPDLKRQRRSRTNSIMSDGKSLDEHRLNGIKMKTNNDNVPSSPKSRQKFKSGPTEVVGVSENKKGCCRVM
uniref:Uncharacterized protein n=1 Tax=Strigamia maritima TaxID=126957 RepID=T1J270_STRMM